MDSAHNLHNDWWILHTTFTKIGGLRTQPSQRPVDCAHNCNKGWWIARAHTLHSHKAAAVMTQTLELQPKEISSIHRDSATALQSSCFSVRQSTHYHRAVNTLPQSCQHATTELSTYYHRAVNILPQSCQHATTELSTHYHRAVNTVPQGSQHTTTELSTQYHRAVNTLPQSCQHSTTGQSTHLSLIHI